MLPVWNATYRYRAGAEIAEDRQTSRQLDLVASLKKRARARHQAFIEGPAYQMAEKIIELEKDVLKDQRQMAKMEARQLEQQMLVLPCAATWVVVLGEEEREKTALKKTGDAHLPGVRLPGGRAWPNFFLDCCQKCKLLPDNADQLDLPVRRRGTFRGLTDPKVVIETGGPEDDQRQIKATDLALCTRLLGGYIATRAWAEKVAVSAANGGDIIESRAA